MNELDRDHLHRYQNRGITNTLDARSVKDMISSGRLKQSLTSKLVPQARVKAVGTIRQTTPHSKVSGNTIEQGRTLNLRSCIDKYMSLRTEAGSQRVSSHDQPTPSKKRRLPTSQMDTDCFTEYDSVPRSRIYSQQRARNAINAFTMDKSTANYLDQPIGKLCGSFENRTLDCRNDQKPFMDKRLSHTTPKRQNMDYLPAQKVYK